MKILFVTPECAPFVKTGGLGDVAAALPPALRALGHEVVTLMPAYGGMRIAGTLQRVVQLPQTARWPDAQLLEVEQAGGGRTLLLSCPWAYASAQSPYGPSGADAAPHAALPFGLLSHVAALLGTAASPLGWHADIVHANDWPCGLAPLYLHHARQAGSGPIARSVMTIHNLAFQGVFPMASADLLDLPDAARGIAGAEFWGQLSMLKAGLQAADAITTVSPTYAREIQRPELGFGLDGVLRSRSEHLHGLLNGIDTAVWNPRTDPLIAARYGADDLAAKTRNRAALRQRLGLPETKQPLLGLVGRLTPQKGVDLVAAGAPRLLAQGAQLVVLGKGDAALEASLAQLARAHPQQVHVTLGFDETLAHQIEAGADCFLMPSRFEPCGLNQMYSQAYGTPPVVTATGGLADTVIDVVQSPDSGTGFVMPQATQAAFDAALDAVLRLWRAPQAWQALQRRGMQKDFGWDTAARQYVALYEALLGTPGAEAFEAGHARPQAYPAK